jgi:hypothetical protein
MGNEVSAKVGVIEGDNTTQRRRTVIAATVAKKSAKKRNFAYYFPNWESYLDDEGNTYYYNEMTQETMWSPGGIENTTNYEAEETIPEDAAWDQPIRQESSLIQDFKLKKAQLIEERREIIKENKMAPWQELAEVAKIDFITVADNTENSRDVVADISDGRYDPEILYKLPWAYKMMQLADAIKDCYLTGGDILDSSKYDNCNDVPRYDNGGLVAWYDDLEDMRININAVLESGVVGQESEQYSQEMKKLQELASGNEEEQLDAFLARKIEVEKQLDSLRARFLLYLLFSSIAFYFPYPPSPHPPRCFAVVSMESGPTREQLDNLYR